jgi:hypothetical protein
VPQLSAIPSAPKLATYQLISTRSKTFVSTSIGLFVTTDHGATWSTATPTKDSSQVYRIVLGMDGALYAEMLVDGDLWKSTDEGATWSQLSGLTSRGLVMVMKDSKTMFSITNANTVSRSTDGGTNWNELSIDPNGKDNRNGFSVFGLSVDNKGQILACLDSGVYTSTNLGDSWTMNSLGLQAIQVENGLDTGKVLGAGDVRQDRFGNYYAASHGRGVFISAGLSSVGLTSKSIDLAVQCYPNPITARAVLSFRMNASANVHYQIVNVTGRTIFSSSDEMMSAGDHDIPLDVSALPSGSYLCEVTLGSERHNVWISVSH